MAFRCGELAGAAVTSHPFERRLRWITVALLVLMGFGSLYSAAYFSWLSWGPPTPNPQAWARLATRAFFFGLLAFASCTGIVIAYRRRSRRAAGVPAGN